MNQSTTLTLVRKCKSAIYFTYSEMNIQKTKNSSSHDDEQNKRVSETKRENCTNSSWRKLYEHL